MNQATATGKSVPYTPVSDVAAGDVVVQGDFVGIAPTAIPAGTQGALDVCGVFDLPKATTISEVPAGTVCYFDTSALNIRFTAGGNPRFGKTIQSAAKLAPTVRCILLPRGY